MNFPLGGNGLTWTLRVTPMSTCYPEHNEGGKIICPPSVLSKITKSEVVYPILFKIQSETKLLHCGPVDWTAEEGRVYVPDWMMQNLNVVNNSRVFISVTELPTGYFVKFKPQSVQFLNKISNPRAVLERKLRNYAALTVGEIIHFTYIENDFYLEVLEVKPSNQGAISIIESNLEVDFEAPDGYVEPTSSHSSSAPSFPMDEDIVDGELDDLEVNDDSEDEMGYSNTSKSGGKATKTQAFSGAGFRPSGKAVLATPLPELASSPSGRTFITSSGSLVVGSPGKPASFGDNLPGRLADKKPVPGMPSSATNSKPGTPSSSSSNKNNTSNSPKPGSPAVAEDKPTTENKFTPFSGSGYRLQ